MNNKSSLSCCCISFYRNTIVARTVEKCAIISIINQSRWRGCLPIRQWSMTSLPLLGDILVVSGNEAAINSETGRETSFVLVTRNCWRNDQHKRCLNICHDHIQLLNKHFRVYGKKCIQCLTLWLLIPPQLNNDILRLNLSGLASVTFWLQDKRFNQSTTPLNSCLPFWFVSEQLPV